MQSVKFVRVGMILTALTIAVFVWIEFTGEKFNKPKATATLISAVVQAKPLVEVAIATQKPVDMFKFLESKNRLSKDGVEVELLHEMVISGRFQNLKVQITPNTVGAITTWTCRGEPSNAFTASCQ